MDLARTTGSVALTLLALAASACASQSATPVNQEVHIRTLSNGAPVDAVCEVGNNLGQWTVIAPTRIGVTRSAEPLSVHCIDDNDHLGRQVTATGKTDSSVIGRTSGPDYPSTINVNLDAAPHGQPSAGAVATNATASINDAAAVPRVDAVGHDGYRRFLAGPSPRAFAIGDNGSWVRVNGSRGADRLAVDRCQSTGAACKLYAVNDAVVWHRDWMAERLSAQ